jgi:hypothetical protein
MVRCNIELETEDVSDMGQLLSLLKPRPLVPPLEPTPQFKGTQAALETVCYELCTGRLERARGAILAIKRLRELTGLSLKESKEAIETLDWAFLFDWPRA